MDDFEKAVLISFNFSPEVGPQLKDQANEYLSGIKKTPACWQLCVERFPVTTYPEVKFWCLQTLHEAIRTWYSQYDSAARVAIKGALTTWLQRDSANSSTQVYLKNKLAQTIVAVVQHEFPSEWPTFFTDLISTLPQGTHMVDMFCRILNSIDEDIISLEIPRSQEESQLSMHVKDAMRESSINDIAAAWYRSVSALAPTQPLLAAAVLDTIHRYVHWIDIGLLANDQFVPLLLSLLDAPSDEVKAGACTVLDEIVTKRMEPTAKLSLVRQLRIVPLLSRWAGSLQTAAADLQLEEAALKLCQLLCSTTTEVLDSLRKVENSAISLAAVGLAVDEDASAEVAKASGAAGELLSELIPATLKAFKCGDPEAGKQLMPFLLAYVGWLKLKQKRERGLSAQCSGHLVEMLEGIALNARYPMVDSCNEEAGALSGPSLVSAREEVEEVDDKRRDLITLLRNISRLGFHEALAFVARILQDVINRGASCPWQEVEVAVILLHELGEGAPEEALQLPNGSLAQAALALMQAQIPSAGHRLVTLAVMEAHVRYCKLLQQEQRAIPAVVATFLDGRGMGHPSQDVSTRACYLFSRLVKILKTPLRPHIATILSSLEPHLARVAATPLTVSTTPGSGAAAPKASSQGSNSGVDDRLYVFEAAGQLLGQEEVGEQQQAAALSSLLQTLSAQVDQSIAAAGAANGAALAAAAAAPGLVLQALEAITRLAKGFKAELVARRKHLGAMFVKALEVAMHAPAAFPGNRPIRAKCISFVHRLVEVLGANILPVLPSTLEVLMQGAGDAPAVEDISGLLQQLVSRFRDSLAPLLAAVLPPLLAQVHQLLGLDWDWSGATVAGPPRPRAGAGATAGESGVVATLEDTREKGDLQKAYYGLLHSLAHNQLAPVLMQLPSNILDMALGGLATGASSHVDYSIRRTCLQVWQALVRECNRLGASTAAFKQFAIDKLAGEVCISRLLASGLDVRDASSIGLLGDASTTLVAVHQAYGPDVLTHLREVLGNSRLPPEQQQRLLECLSQGDAKKLKDVLRAMLQAVKG